MQQLVRCVEELIDDLQISRAKGAPGGNHPLPHADCHVGHEREHLRLAHHVLPCVLLGEIFEKVSALAYSLYKATIEITFENECRSAVASAALKRQCHGTFTIEISRRNDF